MTIPSKLTDSALSQVINTLEITERTVHQELARAQTDFHEAEQRYHRLQKLKGFISDSLADHIAERNGRG